MTRSLKDVRPGFRVTYLVPNGIGRNGIEWRRKTSRAVFGWTPSKPYVVTSGGKSGACPVVVDHDNFLSSP